MAKYYEMNENDMVFTIATDSMELYQSRLRDLHDEYGDYSELDAAKDFELCLTGQTFDWLLELSYWDRKRMHNLKYFTWVEQQGKTVEELDAQWYDDIYWKVQLGSYKEWDSRIKEFNERTGLLKKYE
jgi:cysteine synthase A